MAGITPDRTRIIPILKSADRRRPEFLVPPQSALLKT